MDTNVQALWTERIKAYQASGKSMNAWCEEQNLTHGRQVPFGGRLSVTNRWVQLAALIPWDQVE
ncbi:IS66 family insertion sequence element accessory protein TnpA, partial [Paenibacillus sp. y28]|uniref:IS66 family insertion sequence element accessory protein TnpA n=1 Tax=Paenibacillus sp. y28 TaxID=3129110 RepID=UPI00301EE281